MRTFVLAVACLVFATTASAECAWVLWASIQVSTNGGPYRMTSPPNILAAYASLEACVAKIPARIGDSGVEAGINTLGPTTINRYMERGNVDPRTGLAAEITHVQWQCLPDPVDPRGPKGAR